VDGVIRTQQWSGIADLVDELTGRDRMPETWVASRLAADDATKALWPSDFNLRMVFSFGRALEMELEVRAETTPLTFEEAFHTYLVVGDVRQASVEGLENVEYIDKVDGFKRKTQPAEAIRITGETDRVFLNTGSGCRVVDPVLGRTLLLEKKHGTPGSPRRRRWPTSATRSGRTCSAWRRRTPATRPSSSMRRRRTGCARASRFRGDGRGLRSRKTPSRFPLRFRRTGRYNPENLVTP